MHAPAAVLILSLLAGWSSSGPTGGAVNAVVVAPSDPSIVWAGNSAGVFRSTDGGATWSNVTGNFAEVSHLVVHPSKPDTAWLFSASADATRVYRTDDGGATWTDQTDGLPSLLPSALVIDPRNPDTLYLGSRCDPYNFASIAPLSIEPLRGEYGGVYKSTDGGATWKPAFAAPIGFERCAEELSIDPFSPWRLFSSAIYSEGGQSETYDGAQTWERANGPRPALGVVFDPRFPFTHYGITSRFDLALLVSQDGGFTWNRVAAQPPAVPRALSIDPERSRLFLGTTDGLFRSGNGGTVWAKTQLPKTAVNALDFGGVPRAIFAATSDGLYRVTNRGLGAAQPIDLHDVAAFISAVAVDPSDQNLVYAATRPPSSERRGLLYRSSDNGGSWELVPGSETLPGADLIAVDAAGTVYTSTFASQDLYRRGRTDAAPIRVRHGTSIRSIAVDPKTPGTLFIYTGSTVERSRDGGATWTIVLPNLYSGYIAVDPVDPRWVYAAGEYDFFRSSDGGDTWVNLQPKDAFLSGTRGLAIAPSKPSVLYRIGANVGRPQVERSDDRGATWRPVPFPNVDYPGVIAIDPRDENSVWSSGEYFGAFFHSSDGGATWQPVERPFRSVSPVGLWFSPTGLTLHAIFGEHGVWELSL
jgi:photosystem II stability/assembly factor-like uncharacterized protein